MTREDLEKAGIIVKDKLSDVKLGLLLLNYNKCLLDPKELTNFEKLESEVKKDISAIPNKEKQKEFLLRCLAICDEPIRLAYLKNKDDNLKVLSTVHDLVVKAQPVPVKEVENNKEPIKIRRMLEEEADLLSDYSKKYQDDKKDLALPFNLLKDKEAFKNFCVQFGRKDESAAWDDLVQEFEKRSKTFLRSQDRCFELFVIHNVKSDVRMRAFEGTDIVAK